MKAAFKPRQVEVTQLANGNWLVEDGRHRQVLRPDEFGAAFEIVQTNTLDAQPGRAHDDDMNTRD